MISWKQFQEMLKSCFLKKFTLVELFHAHHKERRWELHIKNKEKFFCPLLSHIKGHQLLLKLSLLLFSSYAIRASIVKLMDVYLSERIWSFINFNIEWLSKDTFEDFPRALNFSSLRWNRKSIQISQFLWKLEKSLEKVTISLYNSYLFF